MYIYPDNLAAKATLWLWELKDLAIIGIGFLIGTFSLVRTGAPLPLPLRQHQHIGFHPLCRGVLLHAPAIL